MLRLLSLHTRKIDRKFCIYNTLRFLTDKPKDFTPPKQDKKDEKLTSTKTESADLIKKESKVPEKSADKEKQSETSYQSKAIQSDTNASESNKESSKIDSEPSKPVKDPQEPQPVPKTKPPVAAKSFTSIPAPKDTTTSARKIDEENLSFVINTFKGIIEAKQVFPYPDVLKKNEKETLQLLIDPVAKFFKEVNNAALNDENEKLDDKILKGLWEMGLLSLQIPEELGGLGLNSSQYARLVEIVGAHDLGLGVTLGAHQAIGFKGILLFGTPEQKTKYLPRLSKGEYAAYCLTETTSGSDAGSIKTKAVLSPDETHYILNGSKLWISNGSLAEIMTVFAQTPIKQPDGKVVNKITAFIVEKSFGGITSGPPEKKMGIKCSNTTEVFYENVKVPVENVLGGVGNGFKVAMTILNNGRFGISAGLSGTMKTCIAKAVEFATQREQFGKKINNFGLIQEKIARMAMLQYVTESITYMVSANMDSGSTQFHLEAAISKCFASEAAWFVCDEAIQIMGGQGYMREVGLERIMRDLRIFRIFEGTNEILRLFIALTGIQYAGASLKELQKAFTNPTSNIGFIYDIISRKMVKKVGLSNLNMNNLIHSDLHIEAIILARKIEDFANRIEILLIKHGKTIVNEQFILYRIANVAIDIYSSAVVLSRATNSLNQNLPSAKIEKLMAQVWTDEACRRITENLTSVRDKKTLENFNKMENISNAVSEKLGVVQNNPLNI